MCNKRQRWYNKIRATGRRLSVQIKPDAIPQTDAEVLFNRYLGTWDPIQKIRKDGFNGLGCRISDEVWWWSNQKCQFHTTRESNTHRVGMEVRRKTVRGDHYVRIPHTIPSSMLYTKKLNQTTHKQVQVV